MKKVLQQFSWVSFSTRVQKKAPNLWLFSEQMKKGARYLPDHFQKFGLPYRFLLLAAATGWIVLKLDLFAGGVLDPIIEKIIAGDLTVKEKIQNLVYFDLLICILIAAAVLFLFSLIFGRPDRPGRLLLYCKNRPIITFAIFYFVLALLMIGAPKLFGDFFLDLRWVEVKYQNIFGVHPVYYSAAKTAAFCVALSIADIAFRAGVTRYWAYLIFIAPFISYPLLWWNAAAWIFPSRYWVLWRPILAAATCVVPALVFPLAQPIRNDVKDEGSKPVRIGSAMQELICKEGYLVRVAPGGNDAYLRCTLESRLSRFVFEKNGHWANQEETSMGYYWKDGAFDFENNRAFFVNIWSMDVEIISLSDMVLQESIPLSPQWFPFRDHEFILDYSPRTGLLAIGSETGRICLMDIETKTVSVAKRLEYEGGERITRLRFNKKGDRLYVLTESAFWVLRPPDLMPENRIVFNASQIDMAVHPATERIFISFPEPAKVLVLSPETFEVTDTIDAPLGVRSMAFDEKRNALFLGSMTGIVQMRNLEDYSLVTKARFPPWIHGLEPASEHGQLFVTFAVINPVVWSYDPPHVSWSLFDQALYLFEDGYLWVVKNKQPPIIATSLVLKKMDEKGTPQRRLLVFSDAPYYDRLEGEITEGMPYHIDVTVDEATFKTWLTDPNRCYDEVIVESSPDREISFTLSLRNWADENVRQCSQ